MSFGQEKGHYDNNKFKQLDQEFATPNAYRTASGAPGHKYYQQKADYKIDVVLNEDKNTISGQETITYHNNSPDVLDYLWLQLDQNMNSKDSQSKKINPSSVPDYFPAHSFSKSKEAQAFDGGFKIESVSHNGKDLAHTINHTMMRIDLPTPLRPGEKFEFNIKWWYNITNSSTIWGRSGYEPFKEGNLYFIAQFFPRMAVYNDVEGWQNLQFFGGSEFALVFGDYKVSITAPSDLIVASTGKLQNPNDVLSPNQIKRLEVAKKTYDKPVIIATESEAIAREKTREKGTKTWVFHAENVRDFAFSASRKFIWDAQAVKIGDNTIMAMSYYPKEGNPLWEQYSTRVVAHTLKVYSRMTFDYPYHKAISVSYTSGGGMEYPMICWNGGRPEKDGTYSKRIKYYLISVIIHEIGHNYFPMIVNSDERKFGWMDEGLNSFVESIAESEWSENYPKGRGTPMNITQYMKGVQDNISPIMTHSDNVIQYGPNCYSKPTAALTILRETIMGRELFDHAFKTYANRWKFKHPTPEDFFRTMEDASGVDLDWFWRGWFYTTDYCDIGIENVREMTIDTENPEIEKPIAEKAYKDLPDKTRDNNRGQGIIPYVERDKKAIDFYDKNDEYTISSFDKKEYKDFLNGLSKEDKELLNDNRYFYEVEFSKPGGLVMPVILEFTFEDGSKVDKTLHAKIWRFNDEGFTKVFAFDKKVKSITVDPKLETADVDTSNNHWPRKIEPSRFKLFKKRVSSKNLMQKDKN
ncbi:M1 family metallopeptidase [Ichthyobacterium seriolicida]|uniref:Zn-dependent aminopeptidase n=1 Tax=Ichthyobacterium seriolicida TaxID=242600 RepID=A0A1J1E8R5_9FLAO|nr:M1 family metallopeptidase [Ichthyobacterium seriolicida]BAV94315.1 Zn-dependent aminopeptidase [Ichthyobacterium seriolicida]